MNTHSIMKLMPEVLEALRATGYSVSLVQDLEAAIALDRQGRGEPAGRNARDAIHGLQGSIAVGSDGEWVSIRRDARDAAMQRLRELSDDCAHMYESYRLASDRADRSSWPTDAMVVLGAEVLHDGLRSLGVDLDEDFRGTTLEQGIAESVFSCMMDLAPQPANPTIKESLTAAEPVKEVSDNAKEIISLVDTLIASVNEAHHAKRDDWRDACFQSADQTYGAIKAKLQAFHGQPAQSAEDRSLGIATLKDVDAMIRMLRAGEWAEHVGSTPMGRSLEDAITKLHAQPASGEDARDAARYRFAATNLILSGGITKFGWVIAPTGKAEWDKYLDAAMQQERQQ